MDAQDGNPYGIVAGSSSAWAYVVSYINYDHEGISHFSHKNGEATLFLLFVAATLETRHASS